MLVLSSCSLAFGGHGFCVGGCSTIVSLRCGDVSNMDLCWIPLAHMVVVSLGHKVVSIDRSLLVSYFELEIIS